MGIDIKISVVGMGRVPPQDNNLAPTQIFFGGHLPATLILWLLPVLLIIAAACGGGSENPIPQEPVSARVIVTDVQVSADDKLVESIKVLTDDGDELVLRMGDELEPSIWGPSHLLSHSGLGKSLGLKISVAGKCPPKKI